MTKKMKILGKRNRCSFLCLSAAVTGFLILAACASTPMAPTAKLQAAQQAIDTAEQARITSPELNEARNKLISARSAVSQEHMILAARLADESRVTAQLASANSETAKAKAVNDGMIKGTNTLKQEMQRNEGVQ